MPVRDVVALVRKLPPGSAVAREEMGDRAGWGFTDANLAELVDLMRYWLWSEYSRWTTDSNDPAVKREMAARKRAGIPPPPMPLVEPVAHRPESIAQQYQQHYLTQVEMYAKPQPRSGTRPGRRMVPMDEFDQYLKATSNSN